MKPETSSLLQNRAAASMRTTEGRHASNNLPVKAPEDAAVVNCFKTESEYARKVEIATLHKVLAILRAAIRWGRRKRRRSSTNRHSTGSAFG